MKRVDPIWDKGATHYPMHMHGTILNCHKMHKKYGKLNERMCKDKIRSESNKYTFSITDHMYHLRVVCVI